MKKFILILIGCSLVFASCKTENQDTTTAIPTITLVDSIEVNYLGVMSPIDLDPETGKILLTNDSFFQFLEIDQEGKILDSGRLSVDGPDAIDMALGLGYHQGKVTVATASDGFKILEDNKIVDKIDIPYSYNSFNILPHLGLYEWNGGKIYGRFSADSLMAAGFDLAFYQRTYTDPVLEYQKDGIVKGLLTLPESSPLRDGNYHGSMIPVYKIVGDQVYFANWLRPEIYVYQKNGDNLDHQTTVKLEIPGWVSYDPIAMENAANFFDTFTKKLPGNLMNIFPMDDYIIISYTKGIPEDKFSSVDFQDPNSRELMDSMNRPYFGILDKNLNAVKMDIPIPAAASNFFVANAQGDIWVSKNPTLSKVEDDGPILYHLKVQ